MSHFSLYPNCKQGQTMNRLISLTLFLFLTIFSSCNLLAADLEDQPEKIELRAFAFDDASLNKAVVFCERSEEYIVNLILDLADNFILNYGYTNLQELYDKNITEASNKNCHLDAMNNITSATLAAICDGSLKLQEDFDHGFLINANFLAVFVKLIFPTIDIGDGGGDCVSNAVVDLCESDNRC